MTPLNILCWETHRAGSFFNQVVFEPAATIAVDVPQGLLAFMNLHRIQYNGDLFNSLYYLYDAPKVMLFGDGTTLPQHACTSLLRRLLSVPVWLLQYLHVLLSVLGSWFTVGAFYLVLHYLTERALIQSKFSLSNGVIYGFKFAFVLLVVGQIIASLGMELGDMRLLYTVIACVYGVGFSLLVVMAVWVGVHSHLHVWLLYGIAVCFGVNAVAVTISGNLYSVAKSALQFVFAAPVYLFMIPIHALATCNDVAVHRRVESNDTEPLAGTVAGLLSPTFATGRFPKGLDDTDSGIIDNGWDVAEVHNLLTIAPSAPSRVDKGRLVSGRRRFSSFRTRILVLWLACNWLLASFFLAFHFSDLFPWAVIGFGVLMTVSRGLGSVVFHCARFCRRMCWLVSCRRHTAVDVAKPVPKPTGHKQPQAQPMYVSHPRDGSRGPEDASFRGTNQRDESPLVHGRENSFTSQSPSHATAAVESRAAVAVAAAHFTSQREYQQYTVKASGSDASLRGLWLNGDGLSRPPSEARTVISRELRDAEDAVQAITTSTHIALQQTSHVQASNRRLTEGPEPLFERSVSDRRGSKASSHRRLSDVVTHSEPAIVGGDMPSRGRKTSDGGASTTSDHRSVSPLLTGDSQVQQQRPSLVALAMRSASGKSLDSAGSSLDVARGSGGIRATLASTSAVQHLAAGHHTSAGSIAVTASLADSRDTPPSPRRSSSPGRPSVYGSDAIRGHSALAPVQSHQQQPMKLGFIPRTPAGGSNGHLDVANATPSHVVFSHAHSGSVKAQIGRDVSPRSPLDASDMDDALKRAATVAMELNMDVQQPLQAVLQV
jgi:hypothetical protein